MTALRRSLVGLAILSAAAAGAQTAPPAAAVLEEIGVSQRLGRKLPADLAFVDAGGRRRSLGELATPRPALLVPVYYECPMLCTETLRGLAGALKALPFDVGLDFDVLVVSFAESEGPEQARRVRSEILALYGERGAASGWHFLTGDAPDVRGLTEAVGLSYVYDPASELYAHTSVLVLLTPERRISRYFFGIDYAPRDLRLGLVEASRGAIGSVVDEVLLYCYRYDPRSGKYGVLVMNVLRASGAATVVLVAGFMLWSFLRDRRRKPGLDARAGRV